MWKACEQSLRLASALLMSPPSVFFISTLMNQPREKLDEIGVKPCFDLYLFCANGRSSWDPIGRKMLELAKIVHFSWGAMDSGEPESSEPDSSEPDRNEPDRNESDRDESAPIVPKIDSPDGNSLTANHIPFNLAQFDVLIGAETGDGEPALMFLGPPGTGGGYASNITINKVFVEYIKYMKRQQAAENINEDPHVQPQLLRLQFQLAVTICHEINHAIGNATRGDKDIEPFHCDDRLNELGFAWEMAVFGGRIAEMKGLAQYPLTFTKWPDFLRADRSLAIYERRPPMKICNNFFLSMQWINMVQQQQFWDVEHVDPKFLRYPKTIGWRDDYEWGLESDWKSQYSSEADIRPDSRGHIKVGGDDHEENDLDSDRRSQHLSEANIRPDARGHIKIGEDDFMTETYEIGGRLYTYPAV